MKRSKRKSHGQRREKNHCKKLVKYIEENDKPRFRSYARKHNLDLREVRLDGDNTLLHHSAKLGNVCFTEYFLKKGVDASHINAEGDLPLHLAVGYALRSSNPFAYTDLVLPLISKCPNSLDVANACDVTCRQLLQHYKASRSVPSETDSSSTSSSEDQEETWSRRLEEEVQDEYNENWGTYEEDFSAVNHPESYDDWADRIHREYRKKKRSWQPPPSNSQKSACRDSGTSGGRESKMPRISADKKHAFDLHAMEESKRRLEEDKIRKHIMYKQRIEKYEGLCGQIFDEVSQSGAKTAPDSDTSFNTLKYEDIPWPTSEHEISDNGSTETDVETFLFEGLSKGSDDYRKYLKVQQRRWHPDRFLQKCGSRLLDQHRDRIITMVTTVSQLLNKLSEDEKPTNI